MVAFNASFPQTKTRKYCGFCACSDHDRHYEELYSKYFKTHYSGKPTRRYLKLMEQIYKAERFSDFDIENHLLD